MAKKEIIGRDSGGAFVKASSEMFNDIRLKTLISLYGFEVGWIYLRTLGTMAKWEDGRLWIRDEKDCEQLASQYGISPSKLLSLWQELSTVGLIKFELGTGITSGSATISLP